MAAPATVSRRPAGVPWAAPSGAVVVAVTTVAATRGPGVQLTRYAETSTLALAADLAAGLAVLAAGVLVGRSRPTALPLLVGVAWSASDWIGAEQLPAARSVAMVVAPFLPVLVAHLGLIWPVGALRGAARTAVGAGYALTAVVAVGQAVVRDPLFDRYCWQNCTDNVFLVRADVDAAAVLALAGTWTTAGLAAVVVGAAVRRGTRSGAVLPLAAVVTSAEAATALLRLVVPADEPSAGPFPALFLVRAGALVALAAALAVPAVRSLRSRAAVRRLARDLAAAPAPGRLEAVLAARLGDDRLQVAYWLDGAGRFVDADGVPVHPEPGPDQGSTAIARGGRTVAVVVHDRALHERARLLQRTIGSAARLAVDNERLRAEVLSRLRDVRASQARVVARSDAVRRTVERDLHDGAQQRLLGVSFRLHAALAAARADGDDAAVALLTAAGDEAVAALAEVRRLAHGIFPAILTDAGLAPALRTFAAGAVLPVEVADVAEERCSARAETAAYVVVVEAVADAVRRSASYATVRTRRTGDLLTVVVADDGPAPGRGTFRLLADRVEAQGGRLAVGPDGVRAELPCG